MARGNRREAIFRDEADRRFFLKTLGEACAMTGWRIHAWVLLSNHYHLFVETPEANLSKGDAMAAEYSDSTLQYTAPFMGPAIWRPLQGGVGGGPRGVRS